MIDATIVALACIAPAPEKSRCASHRPIPPRLDRKSSRAESMPSVIPGEMTLIAAQDHDLTCAESLIEAVDPGALIADKAFDADAFIAALNDRAIVPVIPSKSNRKIPRSCDFALYANAISLSVSSTRSSISGPSPRVTTSSPRFSSPAFSSPAPASSSTEDTPLATACPSADQWRLAAATLTPRAD